MSCRPERSKLLERDDERFAFVNEAPLIRSARATAYDQ